MTVSHRPGLASALSTSSVFRDLLASECAGGTAGFCSEPGVSASVWGTFRPSGPVR
jgi:hypothetical protein